MEIIPLRRDRRNGVKERIKIQDNEWNNKIDKEGGRLRVDDKFEISEMNGVNEYEIQ